MPRGSVRSVARSRWVQTRTASARGAMETKCTRKTKARSRTTGGACSDYAPETAGMRGALRSNVRVTVIVPAATGAACRASHGRFGAAGNHWHVAARISTARHHPPMAPRVPSAEHTFNIGNWEYGVDKPAAAAESAGQSSSRSVPRHCCGSHDQRWTWRSWPGLSRDGPVLFPPRGRSHSGPRRGTNGAHAHCLLLRGGVGGHTYLAGTAFAQEACGVPRGIAQRRMAFDLDAWTLTAGV
jgi:hypothetical protein